MFVEITTPKKPLAADAIFRECYRGDKKITHEICLEVLRSTNFGTCMKRMLECIEKLDVDTQVAYADVVRAVFYNREQPPEVIEVGKRLAKNNGYEQKFDDMLEYLDFDKYYINSAPDAGKIKLLGGKDFYSLEEIDGYKGIKFTNYEVNLYGGVNLPEYVDFGLCRNICLSGCGVKDTKTMKFGERASVSFYNIKDKLPPLNVAQFRGFRAKNCDFGAIKRLGFDKAISVAIENCFNLKGDITVSEYMDNLVLQCCDLTEVNSIVLSPNCGVDFSFCENIPHTDVSECRRVNFAYGDLSRFEGLWFKVGAAVDLSSAKGLPAKSDFYNCTYLLCDGTDFSGVEVLKLRHGIAQAQLRNMFHLPKVLDFSEIDRGDVENMDFSNCSFDDVAEMKFKEGARAYISKADGFSGKVLDFSKCDDVVLDGVDLEGVEKIIFKDGATVVLNDCKNLPKNLDVSMCHHVSFKWCDLKDLDDLKFKKGAEVFFDYAKGLPQKLDLTNCRKVSFDKCDVLFMVEELKLGNGAEVGFRQAEYLPKRLDVSGCGKLDFRGCGFKVVNHLMFAHRQQLRESCAKLPEHLKNKVVFMDEQKNMPALLESFDNNR